MNSYNDTRSDNSGRKVVNYDDRQTNPQFQQELFKTAGSQHALSGPIMLFYAY